MSDEEMNSYGSEADDLDSLESDAESSEDEEERKSGTGTTSSGLKGKHRIPDDERSTPAFLTKYEKVE